MNNMKHKQVTIKDGGKDCLFTIRKLYSTDAFDLIVDIGQIIADTPQVSANTIKQFMNDILSTGVKIKGAKESEQAELLQQLSENKAAFAFDLIKCIFINLSKDKRDKILEAIVPTVTFNNGGELIQLDMIPQSPSNINYYVDDFTTLILLIKEAILLNFGSKLEDFFGAIIPNLK